MPTGQKTTAQRLQEALDELGQARHKLARLEGVEEENVSLREQLDAADADAQLDRGVSNDERRRYTEQIAEAVSARDVWTQRAVRAEQLVRQQRALLDEIKALVVGKECVLPQIVRLLS